VFIYTYTADEYNKQTVGCGGRVSYQGGLCSLPPEENYDSEKNGKKITRLFVAYIEKKNNLIVGNIFVFGFGFIHCTFCLQKLELWDHFYQMVLSVRK
jgi:hypothetical protein